MVERKRGLTNIFRHRVRSPQPSEEELQQQVEEAIHALPSPYDSHPSPANRMLWGSTLPTRWIDLSWLVEAKASRDVLLVTTVSGELLSGRWNGRWVGLDNGRPGAIDQQRKCQSQKDRGRGSRRPPMEVRVHGRECRMFA